MTIPLARWNGLGYRAHDPRWSFDPCSGEGARLKGGRFNRVGSPALYLALSPIGALREAQAGFPYRFQPMTLCAYEVAIPRTFDGGSLAALAAAGIPPGDLACPWRLDVAQGREPASWRLAERLVAAGFVAMLYPSQAPAATAADRNLVIWRWNDATGARVRVIDEEHRLGGG